MPDQTIISGPDDANVPLAALPKTALQAIYHAVTGKTENLSKNIDGSVLIRSADIDRLHEMIMDQIALHHSEVDPVVTVDVKCSNKRSITYSSWERYKSLRLGNHDLTSDVTVKYEFLLKLPGTPSPQRCIVNINLDSSLPVIESHRKDSSEAEAFGFFFVMKREWRSVKVKIDFVDFLIAKSFVAIVEEWFSTLNPTPVKKLNEFLLANIATIRSALGQIGRMGMAAYLVGYATFTDFDEIRLSSLIVSVALGLFIWSLLVTIESSFGNRILRRVSLNIIPTVIIITDTDEKIYEEVKSGINLPLVTVINGILSILGGLAINILASYLFSFYLQ